MKDDPFLKNKLTAGFAADPNMMESMQQIAKQYEYIKRFFTDNMFRTAEMVNSMQRVIDQDYAMQRFLKINTPQMITAADQVSAQMAGVQSQYQNVLQGAATYQDTIADITKSFQQLGGLDAVQNISKQLSELSYFVAERNTFDAIRFFPEDQIQQLAKAASEVQSALGFSEVEKIAKQMMPDMDAFVRVLENAEQLKWIARYEDVLLQTFDQLPEIYEALVIKESGITQPAAEEFRRRLAKLRKRLPKMPIDERTIIFEMIFELILAPLLDKATHQAGSPAYQIIKQAIIGILAITASRRWKKMWPSISEYAEGEIKAEFNVFISGGFVECQLYNAHPQNGPDRKIVLLNPGIDVNQSEIVMAALEIIKEVYPDHSLAKISEDERIPVQPEDDPYLNCKIFGIFQENGDVRDYVWIGPIKRQGDIIRAMFIWNEKRVDE